MLESLSDVGEEDGVDVGPEKLVNYWLEVVQGAHRFEGHGVVWAVDPTAGSESESGSDHVERDVVVEEVGGETAIGGAHMPGGAWGSPVGVEDSIDKAGAVCGAHEDPCGCLREGPSMRMVWQKCRSRLSRASTMGRLSRKLYHSSKSRLVVMMVALRRYRSSMSL